MIRILIGLHDDRGDVGEIRSAWLLVDGAHIHLGVRSAGVVNGVDVNDGQWLKQDLGLGFDELTATPVPAGALYVQPVYIHTLVRGLHDLILDMAGDFIM